MLKQTKVVQGKKVYKGVVEQLNTNPSKTVKSNNRFKIQEEVFDIEDSVADNAKMISLLMTTLSRVYGVLDESQKDAIPAADKSLMEAMFAKFETTQTNADNMVALEGLTGMERLLNRQGKIGQILG